MPNGSATLFSHHSPWNQPCKMEHMKQDKHGRNHTGPTLERVSAIVDVFILSRV